MGLALLQSYYTYQKKIVFLWSLSRNRNFIDTRNQTWTNKHRNKNFQRLARVNKKIWVLFCGFWWYFPFLIVVFWNFCFTGAQQRRNTVPRNPQCQHQDSGVVLFALSRQRKQFCLVKRIFGDIFSNILTDWARISGAKVFDWEFSFIIMSQHSKTQVTTQPAIYPVKGKDTNQCCHEYFFFTEYEYE